MKKIFKAAVVAVAAISCVLSFSACDMVKLFFGKSSGKSYSETFTGAVSAETYESADSAVQGFLDTEISGKTTTAVLVNYSTEGVLSEEEQSKLDIGEEYTEGLLSVEKLTVEYEEESDSDDYNNDSYSPTAYTLASSSQTTYTKTVYLLTYTGMFRFFVPAMTTGDTLTASYYDSTFQGEKYVNCTMEVTMKQTSSGVTLNSTATAKATYDKLYESGTQTVSGVSINYEGYLVDTDNGIYVLMKQGLEDYDGGYAYGYDSINEYFMEWFDERFGQLDHTYFEKTSTGYALRADKYNEYLQSAYLDLTEDFDLSYIINISEGRMSDVTLSISYSGFSSTMSIKFTNFGTTEIVVPESVQALIP